MKDIYNYIVIYNEGYLCYLQLRIATNKLLFTMKDIFVIYNEGYLQINCYLKMKDIYK